jgi:hypothetical protein
MYTQRFLMDTTGCAYIQNRSEAAGRARESCGQQDRLVIGYENIEVQ